MMKRLYFLFAVLVALSLLLSSCGSKDKDEIIRLGISNSELGQENADLHFRISKLEKEAEMRMQENAGLRAEIERLTALVPTPMAIPVEETPLRPEVPSEEIFFRATASLWGDAGFLVETNDQSLREVLKPCFWASHSSDGGDGVGPYMMKSWYRAESRAVDFDACIEVLKGLGVSVSDSLTSEQVSKLKQLSFPTPAPILSHGVFSKNGEFLGIWQSEVFDAECFATSLGFDPGEDYFFLYKFDTAVQAYMGSESLWYPRGDQYEIPDMCGAGYLEEAKQPDWLEVHKVPNDVTRFEVAATSVITGWGGEDAYLSLDVHTDPRTCGTYHSGHVMANWPEGTLLAVSNNALLGNTTKSSPAADFGHLFQPGDPLRIQVYLPGTEGELTEDEIYVIFDANFNFKFYKARGWSTYSPATLVAANAFECGVNAVFHSWADAYYLEGEIYDPDDALWWPPDTIAPPAP